MNKIILHNNLNKDFSFDASNKTITLDSNSIYPNLFTLEYILLITNVTDNIIIYNFGCEDLGGVLNFDILTLEYDTTIMEDSDRIQMVIYTPEEYVDLSIKESLKNQQELLTCLQSILHENKLTNKWLKEINN